MKLRVKELCKQKGITQKALAAKAGITPVGLSKALNGNTTISTLSYIAEALHVPITELFAAQTDCKITCPHCGATLRVSVEELTEKGVQPQQ